MNSEPHAGNGRSRLVKLERLGPRDQFGKPVRIILPNSTRSTMPEIIRMRADEKARTGIVWDIVDA